MAYTNLNFVPGEILTAAKMNLLAANDASFRDGTGIGDNTIQLSKIKNTYSTTEEAIGKWVDGRTIYRRVFVGSNINNINIGSFSKIIKVTMMTKRPNGEWRSIPWVFADGTYTDPKWNAGFYINQNGDVRFQFGQDIKPTSYWHLITEYTKP